MFVGGVFVSRLADVGDTALAASPQPSRLVSANFSLFCSAFRLASPCANDLLYLALQEEERLLRARVRW